MDDESMDAMADGVPQPPTIGPSLSPSEEVRALLIQAFGVAWLKNDLEQHQVLSRLWALQFPGKEEPSRGQAVEAALIRRSDL